ncbi:sensor histidine kinase [Isoptericola halotolerans]|uniref:sensor histidine kinase n=1 Tax=Isoptericola halotolerans TaxID=300560 RepID=UPI00388E2870
MQRIAAGRLLGRPPAPGAEPPRRRDGVLVLVLVAAAVLEGTLRTDLVRPVVTVAVTVVALTTLPWRRVHPLLVVAVATVPTSALELLQAAAGPAPTTLVTTVSLVLAPYALYRWGSGRAVAAGSLLLVGGFAVSVVVRSGGAVDALAGAAFLALLALTGELRRSRLAARERERERITAQERARIARDLHDTLAHTLSGIAVRAQAGQIESVRAPEAAREALRSVEHEARAALTDMRAIVGTLRTDDALRRRPAPGLADLASLASPVGGLAPVVDVRVAPDVEPVGVTVATTVYRLAQEAVTNARRHATGATRVDVAVGRAGGAVTLRVHDDGTAGAPGTTGHGLAGMAERAALLGGRCTAGPDPAGGWTVAATLPAPGGDR